MKISLAHPLLGAHMSIAGGVYNALKEGDSIGCTTIQIFTASNRQWSFKLLPEDDASAFIDLQKKTSIVMVVSHASYLINLGSIDNSIAKKSIQALCAELLRCEQLNIPYVVLHPGSHIGSDEKSSMDRIIENLDEVLSSTSGQCSIVLENSAGQGSSIGRTLEQLAYIRNGVKNKHRIGFCFDTCHGFAAGYDLSTQTKYHDFWKQFDLLLGLDHLKVLHLNDSKKGLNSRVDRHEHIGSGAIGIDSFSFIMNDKHFVHIPKLLETPKEKDLKEDIHNLAVLKKLIHK